MLVHNLRITKIGLFFEMAILRDIFFDFFSVILCFFLLKNRAGARGIQDSKFKIQNCRLLRHSQ